MKTTNQIKVRLPNELHAALQHIARARGVTVTALVKKAIREELAGFGHIPRDEENRAGSANQTGGLEP